MSEGGRRFSRAPIRSASAGRVLWLAKTAVALALASLAIAVPATALGAVRYAEPGGNGPEPCEQSDPCDIQRAVEGDAGPPDEVNNGDEVVLLPGDYMVGGDEIDALDMIEVHGQAGQPRPRIVSSSPGAVFTNAGAAFRHLEIEHSGAVVALGMSPGTAEGVVVESTGGVACRTGSGTSTIRDSVCWTSASGRAAVSGTANNLSVTLRNVTAFASGAINSDGLHYSVGTPGITQSVDAKSVIAKTSAVDAPSQDVDASSSGAGSTVTLTFDHSNYASVSDTESGGGNASVTPANTGTNQNASPAFVNAAVGDFHQASGSPTIDAGATDGSSGTADLDGEQRSLDGNCNGTAEADIGADEFNVPCNDDFADAVALTGSIASVAGSNVNATPESGDGFCTPDGPPFQCSIGRSVWYRWTAPASGPATIDTCAANYDSLLAVFTGSGLGSLTPVATNNNHADCTGTFGSKVGFDATAGTTYHIDVDGCCGAPQGTFTLGLVGPEPPPPPDGGGPDGGGSDTEPPDTGITQQPKDKTKKKQATFEFTSTEPGSSFQCAVDGQALKVACTSPYTVKVKKGSHTFQVRATDEAGNADASPATDAWKVRKKRKKR